MTQTKNAQARMAIITSILVAMLVYAGTIDSRDENSSTNIKSGNRHWGISMAERIVRRLAAWKAITFVAGTVTSDLLKPQRYYETAG